MRAIVAFLILTAFVSASFGTVFRYANETGRKFRYKSLVRFDAYRDGQLLASFDELDKVILEVLSASNGWGSYYGRWNSMQKDPNLSESYKLMETHDGSFLMNEQGRMEAPENSLYPSSRSIPSFTTNDIRPGFSWKSEGIEVRQVPGAETRVLNVPVDVNYHYLGDEEMDGKQLAKLVIDYHVLYFPKYDPDLRSYTGFVHNTLYWDTEARAPYYYFDEFAFMYSMKKGENLMVRGSSESKVEFVSDLTNTVRDTLAAELSNRMPTNKGVTVTSMDDGVMVNLGNILFDINRATVKKDFEPQLDKLAEILRKFPRIDIAVSGHTDNTGSDEYNLSLSELRAKAISDSLVGRGIDPTRISYAGYGSSKPAAENTNETGRTKNRRVEIKLITRE